MDDFKISTQQEKEYSEAENRLYNYIKQLQKSISFNLDGSEKKLTSLPLYCTHMIMQKQIYESAVKFAVFNYEISLEDFKCLVNEYTNPQKIDSYIEQYKSKKLEDFSFKSKEFKNIDSALGDLMIYTNGFVDYIYDSSIFEAIEEIPFIEPLDLNGLYYLDTIAESAFLGIDAAYDDTVKDSKNRYIKLFQEEEQQANREIYEEVEDYFETLYNSINLIFPVKYRIDILEHLFTALLKLEFNHNLTQAVTDTKNKYKEYKGIKINDSDLASFINISFSTFSNYGSKSFPSVDGLYKLADVIDTSCDTLLGRISQDDINEEELYKKYGLNSSTLKYLEQLKRQSDIMKSNYMDFINEGLNLCFQSLQSFGYTQPNEKYYIDITNEEINELKSLYDKGNQLIEDESIPFSIDYGLLVKTLEDIEVKYTKKQKIYRKDSVTIKKTPLSDTYIINEKEITYKKNDNLMYIKYRDIVNAVNHDSFEDYKKSGFKEQYKPLRYHIKGDKTTDFLAPLLRFLNPKLQNRLFSFTEKDLNYLSDTCSIYNEIPDIEDFFQEVSTNYGYENYESDTLHIMEIIDKLRKYKEHLRNIK